MEPGSYKELKAFFKKISMPAFYRIKHQGALRGRAIFLTAAFAVILVLAAPLNFTAAYPFGFLSKNAYPHINYRNEIYFKNAFADYSRGNYKKAAALFRLYAAEGKLLKNYALYYRGLCFFKLKHYHRANYVFLKLKDSGRNFPFYKNAVFYLAISEEKNGYAASEISNFKYIAVRSKKSAVRSYAVYKIYKSYLKLKDYKSARKYLLELYIDYPYFSKKHDIRFNAANLPRKLKIERGRNLYYDSFYSESLALLKSAVPAPAASAPAAKRYGKADKEARFIMLEDLMRLNGALFLADAEKCLNRGRNSGRGCYKYYGVGRLKILNLESRYYYYILRNPPKTLSSLNYTAEKYGYLNKNAMEIYKNITWNYALKCLKKGNYAAAAKSLKPFLAVNDDINSDNAKLFFWYGVALEKLGFKSKASFYFNLIRNSGFLRYSYYGIMSGIAGAEDGADFAGRDAAAGAGMPVGADAKKSVYAFKNFNAAAFKSKLESRRSLYIAFKRFKAFLNLKLYELSGISMQRFISAANKNFSENSAENLTASLAYMLYKSGYYQTALYPAYYIVHNYGRERFILNRRFLAILYPRPYYGYVGKYSGYYGVPENLIYGVMRQESLYNPACYSSAEAIGLMQIIPSTGYYIANRTKCFGFNPSMLYKKNINISFGSYYLKTLLNRFYNSKYLAIASYNAGPGAVSYWKNYLLKNYKMPLFIELIPYSQTRNYVKKVLANYYVYNYIYK